MSNNRLYIYDEDTKEAILFAKGWGSGWVPYASKQTMEAFLDCRDFASAYSCDTKTRLKLMTEADLPADAIRFDSEAAARERLEPERKTIEVAMIRFIEMTAAEADAYRQIEYLNLMLVKDGVRYVDLRFLPVVQNLCKGTGQ